MNTEYFNRREPKFIVNVHIVIHYNFVCKIIRFARILANIIETLLSLYFIIVSRSHLMKCDRVISTMSINVHWTGGME